MNKNILGIIAAIIVSIGLNGCSNYDDEYVKQKLNIDNTKIESFNILDEDVTDAGRVKMKVKVTYEANKKYSLCKHTEFEDNYFAVDHFDCVYYPTVAHEGEKVTLDRTIYFSDHIYKKWEKRTKNQ